MLTTTTTHHYLSILFLEGFFYLTIVIVFAFNGIRKGPERCFDFLGTPDIFLAHGLHGVVRFFVVSIPTYQPTYVGGSVGRMAIDAFVLRAYLSLRESRYRTWMSCLHLGPWKRDKLCLCFCVFYRSCKTYGVCVCKLWRLCEKV